MHTISSPIDAQKYCLAQKKSGKTVGFVPTMGFLHKGHASLMRIARAKCDFLVTSIYVNPLQFGANEDLDVYPRDPEGDTRLCQYEGVDLLFMPTELYSKQHSTFVHVDGLTDKLCGASRPTHFRGVTTVVARLFGLIQPDIAVFGEKDYQQLAVLRRMSKDLALPIDIIGAPLVRAEDNLALSSRNRYLDPQQRKRALSISQTLFSIADLVTKGEFDIHVLRRKARDILQVDELDYLEFVHPDTLVSVKAITQPTRLLIAAWVGQTRLIDNLLLTPPS